MLGHPIRSVQVKRDGINSWLADSTYPVVSRPAESYGCFYEDDRFAEPQYYAPEGSDGWDFVRINFMVRYSKDPWLGYMRVTSGSGKFGLAKIIQVGFQQPSKCIECPIK